MFWGFCHFQRLKMYSAKLCYVWMNFEAGGRQSGLAAPLSACNQPYTSHIVLRAGCAPPFPGATDALERPEDAGAFPGRRRNRRTRGLKMDCHNLCHCVPFLRPLCVLQNPSCLINRSFFMFTPDRRRNDKQNPQDSVCAKTQC